jgi:hypothetical protein
LKIKFIGALCLSVLFFNTSLFGQKALSSSANIFNDQKKIPVGSFKLNSPTELHPRLRNTGIGFTLFGIATIIGGSAMVSAADGETSYSSNNYNGQTQTQGSFTGAMGTLGIVGGSISTIGGMAMWYFGNKKLQKEKRRASVSLGFNSATISYKF